jgi:DNA polymerase III alpha subunit
VGDGSCSVRTFVSIDHAWSATCGKGILCQGRGSAANSAVCYCLGITEVDPARMEMLFERFISRERGEPPDIDVDFEHQRREEVIQYIYRKYGRDRAALAATVIATGPRARCATSARRWASAGSDRPAGAQHQLVGRPVRCRRSGCARSGWTRSIRGPDPDAPGA